MPSHPYWNYLISPDSEKSGKGSLRFLNIEF